MAIQPVQGRFYSVFCMMARVTGVLLVVPTIAAANGSHPFFNKIFSQSDDSFIRLRSAYDAITGANAIRDLRQDPKRTLVLTQRLADESLETTKVQDCFEDMEVVGSMAFHHRDRQGAFITDYLARFDLDVRPRLGAAEAIALAKDLEGDKVLDQLPLLKIFPSDDNTSAKLVYWVTLLGRSSDEAGADVIIDAHSGALIARTSHRISLAPPQAAIEIYAANQTCQSVDEADGSPKTLNIARCERKTAASSQLAQNADNSARRAYFNSMKTFDYFMSRFGRNSYDDAGAKLVNIVHVGRNFSNAFWDPYNKFMGYGDGDGVVFGDFTQSLDVAGHEMTHAITASTAGLLYFGEYGALNESYSDFFGKMIADDGHWAIGKELFINSERSDGLRDLANPDRLRTGPRGAWRPYPKHISEIFQTNNPCIPENDFCFVHINSTIMGHAAYQTVERVGKEKAEKIYYRALTQLIGPRTNFRTAKNATLLACTQLYDEETCAQVREAFAQVGL